MAETIATKALVALLESAGLKLSDRRLRQIAQDGFFPEPDRGEWPREKVLLGLAAYYFQLKGKKSKEFEEQEFRKLKESADEIAIRNETSRGRLVEAEAVYRENEKLFIALKARILASALSDLEKDELLNDLVRLTARSLAVPAEPADDSAPAGSAPQAAAAP